MKQFYIRFLTILSILLMGCGIVMGQNAEELLKIGMHLPKNAEINNSLLISGASSMVKSYKIKVDNINFMICTDKNDIVNYIETKDNEFETPDGVRVGATYADILMSGNYKLLTENGWAYYIKLPSGWYAAFTQGDSMTEGDLSKNSKVKWLFKREY